MNKILMLLAALTMGFTLAAAPVMAEEEAAAPQSIEGTVISVDSQELILQTSEGEIATAQIFHIEPATQFGELESIDALSADTQVSVEYVEQDGRNVALSIAPSAPAMGDAMVQ